MSFVKFFVDRELFMVDNKKGFSFVDKIQPMTSGVVSLDLAVINFSKPRLTKSIISLNFPFLVFSNGALFFYNSAYSNFFFNLKRSGILLFDDLYSFKNKVVF